MGKHEIEAIKIFVQIKLASVKKTNIKEMQHRESEKPNCSQEFQTRTRK